MNNHELKLNPLIDEYLNLVSLIEKGQLEKASSAIHDWRVAIENSEFFSANKKIITPPLTKNELRTLEDLRRLLSVRLALKGGFTGDDILLLVDKPTSNDLFIRAEFHFIRGLIYYHANQHQQGSTEFAKAKELYLETRFIEKYLLSSYNHYIGKVNSEELDYLDQHLILTELEQEALKYKNQKILAWVLRQKSYLMQFEGRFAAALSLIQEATQIFRMDGPQSDFHLSILQTADCYLDLGNKEQAQCEIEKIYGPVDARVDFAKAYVLVKMGHQQIDLNKFSVRPPSWEKKWRKTFAKSNDRRIQWNLKTGTLSNSISNAIIIYNSKEGQLIRILMEAKRSKNILCEMLWPEQMQVLNLENRFHKLVSRINKKLKLIDTENGSYFLTQSIELIKDPS